MTAPRNPTIATVPPPLALRPADQVMRLSRMGASFPTRLSFGRTLLRNLAREAARVSRPVWQVDDEGYGHAVYQVSLGGHTYSLVAFSLRLAPEQRTDRVIAEAWDTSYVLFDGVPDAGDIERLSRNAPLQEAGRFDERDLILCRANKSVRLFEHVIESLAAGRQPDIGLIRSTGYLMRTTAVYGNGKFGIADRERIADRPGLGGPFMAEMLTVWLIRGFTHDLVEHIASRREPDAFTPLSRVIKHALGIGNATGLGMAPFLVSHPILLHNWMNARETALARVRAQPAVTQETIDRANALVARVKRHLAEWSVEDEKHMRRIETVRREFGDIAEMIDADFWRAPSPWERMIALAQSCSLDCQELIVALALEPNGPMIDDLADTMAANVEPALVPAMTVATLLDLLNQTVPFAPAVDFSRPDETALFWYVSEEKLEPRLGHRRAEAGAEFEMPLDIARRVQALAQALETVEPDQSVAEFLLRAPHHRHAVMRVQTAAHYPYSEIHDNLIAECCLPIDMLRCKLAFFGAAKFDPRSDRWTRITLFQGAPLFDELDEANADDWWLPVIEDARHDDAKDAR